MKSFITVLCIAAVSALAGCASAPTVNPADVVSAIASGCLVVQPTLSATSTAVPDPNLGLATAINGAFCTANEAAAAAMVQKAAVAAPASAAVPASAASAPAAK